MARTPSFTAQNGAGIITVFSSFIGMVHLQPQVLYARNIPDYKQGLQQLAENGDISTFLSSFRFASGVEVIGVATEPSSGNTGILAPGQSFTLLLSANSTDARLSLASSFLQGNDIVIATPDLGVPLFSSDGVPLTGDISDQMDLYDIGTEKNEAPGIGPNQVLRQNPKPPEGQVSAGTPENQPVKLISEVNDGFSYPRARDSIRITIKVRELGTSANTPSSAPSPSATDSTSSPSPSPNQGEETSTSPSPEDSPNPDTSPSPEPSTSTSLTS
ncbi:MAG TPA: spondin domain-containing protein [Oligoflexia bacterium]|nr:spondin domain-containing protein [Oligoflexia bacterium]